jgi:zinc transporter ZupT
LYTVAISGHVLLADRVLDKNHKTAFRQRFRWLGSSALALGTIHAAILHPISDLALAVATAFVGGGLLISVFREELPSANQSRLAWFFFGLIAMITLLLMAIARHAHA